MKSIKTTYLSWTDKKPSRIKASAEGVPSKTYSSDSLDHPLHDKHIVAAQRFAQENDWIDPLASGGTKNPNEWVHCFVKGEKNLVAICGCGSLQSVHKDWKPCAGEEVTFSCDHCAGVTSQKIGFAIIIP